MALLVSSEPRPLLTDYVLTKYPTKVTSALPVLYWKHSHERKGFLYECRDYEKAVRKLKTLDEPELSAFKERFMSLRTDFMVFHVLFKDKDACVARNRKNENGLRHSPRHGVMLLYNKVTHRIYRYDILRYHYRGFKGHLFGKRLKSVFIPWLRQFDPKVKLIEMDITPSKRVIRYLHKKLGGSEPPIKVWYPLYVLLEIDAMMSHPEMIKRDLRAFMMSLTDQEFNQRLEHLYFAFGKFLLEFYETYNTCVTKSRIVDPAKLQCISATGRRALLMKGIKNVCGDGKVLSLYNRCIKSKFYDHFDFGETELVDTPDRKNFIKMGSLVGSTIAAMYMASKFKNLAVFIPPKLQWDALRKEDVRFTWKYHADSGWDLEIPEGFKTFWEKTIQNKKIDYIIVPVSMTSKPKEDLHVGYHANILLFNKTTRELEHFEPHGLELNQDAYNPHGLYDRLRIEFKGMVKKYLSPLQVCPKNLQFFQSVETDEVGFLNDHGHCAVWCIWYVDVRLSNPTIQRQQVINLAMQKMLDMGSLRMFIWNYEKHFSEIIGKLSGYSLAKLKKQKITEDVDQFL